MRWRRFKEKLFGKDPDTIVEEFKIRSGQVPGGVYTGIAYIPGDLNSPWEEREHPHWHSSECPACGGTLRYLYQTDKSLKQDGEYRTYYKSQCKDCNYLDDTGTLMTKREVRASRYVYCDKVKAETFNRTGYSCNFVVTIGDMVDVCQLIEPCEECPHPY
jgi:hypothetical protein